jgi:hypothetical protein
MRSLIEVVKVVKHNFPLELVDFCIHRSGGGFSEITCVCLVAETMQFRPDDTDFGQFYSAACRLLQASAEGEQVIAFTAGCILLASVADEWEVQEDVVNFVAQHYDRCATGAAFEILLTAGRGMFIQGALQEVRDEIREIGDGTPTPLQKEKVLKMLNVTQKALKEVEEPVMPPETLKAEMDETLAMKFGADDGFAWLLALGRGAIKYTVKFGISPVYAGIPQMFEAWINHDAGEAFTGDIVETVFKCFKEGANADDWELKHDLLMALLRVRETNWILGWSSDSEDFLVWLSGICRILQSWRGMEISNEVWQFLGELCNFLRSDPDEWKTFAFLEVVMSMSYYGVKLEEIGIDLETVIAQVEMMNWFVSNYHRLLFAHFLEQHNGRENPMFEVTMTRIIAGEDWVNQTAQRYFDKIPSFLPEIPGFVRIERGKINEPSNV